MDFVQNHQQLLRFFSIGKGYFPLYFLRLVLQAEGLVCDICNLGFLIQTTLAGVFSAPQQIAVLIGHLSRDADLVAVEVVGLLDAFAFPVGPVVYLCVSHMPYARIGSFMRATTYLFIFISITIALKRGI